MDGREHEASFNQTPRCTASAWALDTAISAYALKAQDLFQGGLSVGVKQTIESFMSMSLGR